jgi:hypothetical protein
MKGTPLKADSLDLDELSEEASCSDWLLSQREVQPVGFPIQHSHEGLSKAPAVTIHDVARLAAEVAQMRAQFSRALSEIKQKLSVGKEPQLSSRRTRPARRAAAQSVLPFIPTELSPIADAIENSRVIFNRQPDPSDDLALACSQETWQRATKILIDHALAIWEKAKVAIRPPAISAGPDGSVDLYWTAAPYGLLLNVPADPQQPATYFWDEATNPDSNRTSGKLDPTKPIDIGVLMWLARTAEQ